MNPTKHNPSQNKTLTLLFYLFDWCGSVARYADFAAAVLDGASTQGSVDEAIADLHVVRALLSSAETGQWVDL